MFFSVELPTWNFKNSYTVFQCAKVEWHKMIDCEIFWILWVWFAMVGLLCIRRCLWLVLETQVVLYLICTRVQAVVKLRMTLVSFVVYVHSCTGILVSLINREWLMTIVIVGKHADSSPLWNNTVFQFYFVEFWCLSYPR